MGHGSAPDTPTWAAVGIAIATAAPGGNRAGRVRVRSASNRRGPRPQDLSLSRLRPRNPFRHRACGGMASWLNRSGSRGPAALAHPVLGQPGQPGPYPEVVL